MPTVANGIDLDWAFSRANGQNWEFELRKGLFAPLLNPKREGAVRVLSYVNHAHMGDYRESVQQYLAGKIATPDITQTERFGAVKYGFGLNTEQEVTDSLRLFGALRLERGPARVVRLHRGRADDPLRRRLQRHGWRRPNDKVGVAYVSNAIKRDHQNYLHYGGLGFLLGDGNLTYGREDIVEWYYNAHLWRGLLCHGRRVLDRPSRLQPRPRAGLCDHGARAHRFLRQIKGQRSV